MKQLAFLVLWVLLPGIASASGYEERSLATGQTVWGIVHELAGDGNLWRNEQVMVLHRTSDLEYEKSEQVMRRLPVGARVLVGQSLLSSFPAPSDSDSGLKLAAEPLATASAPEDLPRLSQVKNPVLTGSVAPLVQLSEFETIGTFLLLLGSIAVLLFSVRRAWEDVAPWFGQRRSSKNNLDFIPLIVNLSQGNRPNTQNLRLLNKPRNDFSDISLVFKDLPEKPKAFFELDEPEARVLTPLDFSDIVLLFEGDDTSPHLASQAPN